jgi:hypothetical protein
MESNQGTITITDTASAKPFEVKGKENLNTSAEPIYANASIDWKGHLQANSGKIGAWNFIPISQTVSSTTASAGSLYSGSQPSQWSSIILDPVKNEVTGGKFKASILEALDGTIKLGGFIRVYDADKKVPESEEIDYTSTDAGGGQLGFMTANFGVPIEKDGATEETIEKETNGQIMYKAGIGLKYNNSSIKATNENTGMSFGSYFISLQTDKAVFRTITDYGSRLILDSTHIGMGHGKSSISTTSSNVNIYGASQVKLGLQVLKSGSTDEYEFKNAISIGTGEIETHYQTKVSGDLTIGRNASAGENADKTLQLYGNLSIDVNNSNENKNAIKITKGSISASNSGLTIGSIGCSGASYFFGNVGIGYSTVTGLSDKITVNGSAKINGTIRTQGLTGTSNLNWKSGVIDFEGAEQKGIYACFA